MITAIVGTYDRDFDDEGSSRGAGKTTSMIYYLHADKYEEGRNIFTNFKCSFATVLPAQKIVNEILGNQKKYLEEGVSVGLTEMSTVLNSLGSTPKQILFLNYWAGQTRKLNCDLYWDIQRYEDANNRLRSATDTILKPKKYHYSNNKHCRIDRCKEHHYVKIFSEKPYISRPITGNEVIDTWVSGELYDTNELVFDEIIIKSDKEKKQEQQKIRKLEVKEIAKSNVIKCPECKSENLVKFAKNVRVCYDCETRFTI
jgi:hypothetical protein